MVPLLTRRWYESPRYGRERRSRFEEEGKFTLKHIEFENKLAI
jgi:hypothetical protein